MTQQGNLRTMGITALCIGVLVLGACGGGDEDTNPAVTAQAAKQATGAVDACSLLSQAEAADAVGGATNPPQSSMIGEGFSQCLWRIQGGSEVDSAVVLQARGDTSAEDFERFVEENAPAALGELTPIAGLGDQAFQQMATFVLAGDSMVVVTVLNGEPLDQQHQRQKALAQAAIDRLP